MDQAANYVAAHSAQVWMTITRILRAGDHDAEDCFQETFVEFWQIAQKQKVEHPRALMIRIATRRAIDVIRRRKVARERFPRAVDESNESKAIEPSSHLMADELADALIEALVEMPEAQAIVFCMTQLELMDHSDVARTLGKSSNHVAVLLKRARTQLQSKLARFDQSQAHRKSPVRS